MYLAPALDCISRKRASWFLLSVDRLSYSKWMDKAGCGPKSSSGCTNLQLLATIVLCDAHPVSTFAFVMVKFRRLPVFISRNYSHCTGITYDYFNVNVRTLVPRRMMTSSASLFMARFIISRARQNCQVLFVSNKTQTALLMNNGVWLHKNEYQRKKPRTESRLPYGDCPSSHCRCTIIFAYHDYIL